MLDDRMDVCRRLLPPAEVLQVFTEPESLLSAVSAVDARLPEESEACLVSSWRWYLAHEKSKLESYRELSEHLETVLRDEDQ